MAVSEHITALFISGWFYLYIGNEKTAYLCWQTAADILDAVSFVGEA